MRVIPTRVHGMLDYDYELGIARLIPMPVHLGLELLSGIVLAASPWLFGFADDIWWPHVLFGLIEIGAALMTRMAPEAEAPGRPSSASRRWERGCFATASR